MFAEWKEDLTVDFFFGTYSSWHHKSNHFFRAWFQFGYRKNMCCHILGTSGEAVSVERCLLSCLLILRSIHPHSLMSRAAHFHEQTMSCLKKNLRKGLNGLKEARKKINRKWTANTQHSRPKKNKTKQNNILLQLATTNTWCISFQCSWELL